MKNIIIPIDFSECSEHALKTGAMFAKKHKVSLTLVHMIEMPYGYSTHDSEHAKSVAFMLKFAEMNFKKFIDKDYLEDIDLKIILKHYALFPEIGNIAIEENADLILMGTHGITKYESLFSGTNTEKVVKSSSIPVLVVKKELQNIDFEKIIYVSDFKLESVKAYQKAKVFYNVLGIKPELLFINTPGNSFIATKDLETRIKTFLMNADGHLDNLDSFICYDDHTVLEGVDYFIEKNNTSLVTVATHGKSKLSNLFNHSVSIDIANHVETSVLTLLI